MAINHGSLSARLTPRGNLRGNVQPAVRTAGCVMLTRTKAEWNAEPELMSAKNTIYVYSDYRQVEDIETHETYYIPRAKIGDGTTYVIDLPFATMSITDEDIARWNNATSLSVEADDETETLIFTL